MDARERRSYRAIQLQRGWREHKRKLPELFQDEAVQIVSHPSNHAPEQSSPHPPPRSSQRIIRRVARWLASCL